MPSQIFVTWYPWTIMNLQEVNTWLTNWFLNFSGFNFRSEWNAYDTSASIPETTINKEIWFQKKKTHNLVKEDTDDQWAAYTWKNKERDKMLSLNAKSIADKRLRRDLKSDKFADKTSKNLTESGSTLTHTEVVPKSPTKCMEAILKKHSNICMYKRTVQTCYLSIMKSIQTSSFSK